MSRFRAQAHTGSHHLVSDQFSVARLIGSGMFVGGRDFAYGARVRGDIIIFANDRASFDFCTQSHQVSFLLR